MFIPKMTACDEHASFAKLMLAFFLCCFLLYRPFQLQLFGMMYSGDDCSYFAYTTSITNLKYPSFTEEFVDEGTVPPLSRVGPGLIAAPIAGLFSIVDRVIHAPIIDKRDRETTTHSWTVFGSILTAILCLGLSCIFLYQGLLTCFSPNIAALSVALMVLCQGTPLYAFRRPVFSHVYELFLFSVLFFIFQKRRDTEFNSTPSWGLTLSVACLCSLSLLVRQNALLYVLLWPTLILGLKENKFCFNRIKYVFVCLALSFISYWVIKYFPYWMNPKAYDVINAQFENTDFMFKILPFSTYVSRIRHIFIGPDWGLVFTAPFILLSVYGLFKLNDPFKRFYVFLALPSLVNFYIVMIWMGQGSWYGYRYLIFPAMPALLFPLASLLRDWLLKPKNIYYVSLIAIFPVMSMVAFEGNNTNLTLYGGITNQWGASPANNPILQWEIWKTLFTHPFEILYAFVKAGPSYIIYLIAQATGYSHQLPSKFLKVYERFELNILIKTLIIYAVPLFMYWCNKKCYPSPNCKR